MIIKGLTITFLAAAFLVGPRTSSASSINGDETVSKVVRYADLNLDSRSGARTMLQRIDATARQVCEPAPAVSQLGERAEWQACVVRSERSAVSRLNAPMVTAEYYGTARKQLAMAQASPRRQASGVGQSAERRSSTADRFGRQA